MISNIYNLRKIVPDLNTKVISFDVFDTLIIRNIEPPKIPKLIVAENISRANIIPLKPSELIKLRERFELELCTNAKNNNFDYVYSIEKLYEYILEFLNEPEYKKQELIDMEVAVELALIHPMPYIKSLLYEISKNYRIIAISDTYYSSRIINKFLEFCNLSSYFDDIYCSSDYNLTKSSGNLYEQVLKSERIDRKCLLHIGDNFTTDYQIPRAKGINTVLLYDNWNYERRYFLKSISKVEKKSEYLNGYSIIYGINSLDKDNKDELYKWGKLVMGPLLTLYIDLLVNEIIKNNFEKIFFIAREGFILKKIYNMFAHKINMNLPESKYIALSRYTTFIAAIKNLDVDTIIDMAIYGDSIPFKDAVSRLGFEDLSVLSHFINTNDIDIDKRFEKKEISVLLKKLIGDKQYYDLIIKNSEAMSAKLEQYLYEEEFLKKSKFALVDVGWRGTIQYCIQNNFSGIKDFPDLTGFHLGLDPPVHFKNNHDIRGLIYDYRYSFPEDSYISMSKGTLEICTIPNHGATIGYKNIHNSIIPVFSDNQAEKANYAFTKLIQKGILDFTHEYLKLKDIYVINPDNIKPLVIKLYNYHISNPTNAQLNIFKNLFKSRDFGSDRTNPFITEFSIREILNFNNFKNKLRVSPWKEASILNSKIPLLYVVYEIVKRLSSWRNSIKFLKNEKNTF